MNKKPISNETIKNVLDQHTKQIEALGEAHISLIRGGEVT